VAWATAGASGFYAMAFTPRRPWGAGSRLALSEMLAVVRGRGTRRHPATLVRRSVGEPTGNSKGDV
jgi:hypothetical protein